MPIAFVTAQYFLLDVSSGRRGSTVLVNSAGSALGRAAVQIAQLAGAKVFALVSSKYEKEILLERYDDHHPLSLTLP
ncbi:NAD(P)-binding domain protein [Metarhizium guizhouense ARSEF 977]|uniref:NAD(P)-binding domain protein n=1 Tax=Metarhizium guizhouense (strain ARSEF 977) TaxID=1276136 RepID=A0A0B4GZJ3_METGA|nr:NAD(P)-binding domain protein [Metarhizium guizhouense ARSEF 977]